MAAALCHAPSVARADSWVRFWGTGTRHPEYCAPQGERVAGHELLATNFSGDVLILGSGHPSQPQAGVRRGWGTNASGVYSWPPTGQPEDQVRDFPDLSVTPFFFHSQLALGQGHAVAIADGVVNGWYVARTVVCWGANELGQCEPPQEPWGSPLHQIVQVSCGTRHTIALRSNGQVRAWGSNSHGQSAVPQSLVDGVPGVVQVSGGGLHSMALRGDGSLVCWGAGSPSDPVDGMYQCGQSAPPASLGPVRAVSAGGVHSAALRADGSVVCWGAGSGEAAFNFNVRQSRVPADLGPCTRVSASVYATAALQSDGVVRVWGWEQAFGQCSGQCDVPSTLGAVADMQSTFVGIVLLSNQSKPNCPADIEPSCAIDGDDLGVLLAAWGPQPAGSPADITGDGLVDGEDLGALLVAWGACEH